MQEGIYLRTSSLNPPPTSGDLFGDTKELAQGCVTSKWWSLNLNLGLSPCEASPVQPLHCVGEESRAGEWLLWTQHRQHQVSPAPSRSSHLSGLGLLAVPSDESC